MTYRRNILPGSLGALAVFLTLALGVAAGIPGSAPDEKSVEFFEKRVRPLLAEKCYSCHSAKTKLTQGGLALDSAAGWKKGGGRGPAIAAGDPDKSLLVRAVRYQGDVPKMPPTGKLADSEIAVLVEWVKMGAPGPKEAGAHKTVGLTLEEGRKFWSFQPLKRVPIPAIPDSYSHSYSYSGFRSTGGKRATIHAERPITSTSSSSSTIHGWARSPIDQFILTKLTEKGLKPNLIADRRTLIRRAYFDLIGLPPSPEEIDAFIDDKSPAAWPKLIDRLLASPHYGERWGRHWLDLARFAESHGYEQDYDRPYAYYYRDFVIKALNQDLPYDKFVRWQLAGDEFEPENPLALMATGFLAAGTHATQITKNQVEKERYDELDDMLSVTCTSLLGVTAGCARCHDHKYDPIPTRDYYRMLSTFTTTVRSDFDVNMDPEGYRTAKASFDAEHSPLVEQLHRFEAESLPGRFDAWLKSGEPGKLPRAWSVLEMTGVKSEGGATLTVLPDGSVLASGKNPETEAYTFTATTRLKGISAVRLEAMSHPTFVKSGPGRAPNGNFALSDFRVTAAPANGTGKPVDLQLTNPRVTYQQPTQLIKDSVGKDKKLGWAIDPQFGKDHAAVWNTASPIGFEGGTVLTFTLKFEHPNASHIIGRPRISVSANPSLDLSGPARPERDEHILADFSAGKTDLAAADRAALQGWYRTIDPEWQRLNAIVDAHLAKEPKPDLHKVLISSEGVPAVRTHTQGGDFLDHTWFLKRGDPNQKQEAVTQSFLQVLMHTPDGERHWETAPPKGWRTCYQRRALAEWMTDVDKGAGALLARVIVNRLWQHHMGRGIVGTPSDFGTQGERPTHPELLEWLASELVKPTMDDGRWTIEDTTSRSRITHHASTEPSSIVHRPSSTPWSLKRLHKLIMTSAVYMQTASVNPAAAKVDPGNRLCWRHSRQRLEAEIIRDSMLAASGQLDETMFGPGTLDEGMKRRSLYFFVKRSKLVPEMILFDAPNTLGTMAVRPATTVAPQALMLMNNPNVRAYALALAKRATPTLDIPPPIGVTRAYRLTVGRVPTREEMLASLAFISQQAAAYRAAGETNSNLTALADFCQALFGLNEFVYVD